MMKIIKKQGSSLPREDAHGGSGGRKLYVGENELRNVTGMTYGYLPVGSKFAWHVHDNIDEIMLVLKGNGIVRDHDGDYSYSEGDLFIFPSGIEHEIENPGDYEHEYVFVRVIS